MGRTVAVIGAGVSGLAVSAELASRAQRTTDTIRPLCLEASPHPGGNIRTLRREGFLCEWGPNGFLDNAPTTLTLVRSLGLEERRISSRPEAATRFIFRGGKLRRVPLGPGELLRSDLLSAPARLRLCMELLIPRRSSDDDESIFDFAARRIGREAATTMIGAMVRGIFAGDARQLSVASTFPKMVSMEAEYGGLIRAMLSKMKQARKEGRSSAGAAGGALNSFKDGMQELIDALVKRIGDSLRTNFAVGAISDMGVRGMRVHPVEGAPIDVDAVVLACPAAVAATLVESMDSAMAEAMAEIPSAPVAVVHLGYRIAALGEQPIGFGFLVPRVPSPRILGTLWSSQIFDGRSPAGSCLMTVMVGGANDPDAVTMDDAEMIESVCRDLELTMGIVTRPHFIQVVRHLRGIPQYTLGHPRRLAVIDERVQTHPGLWIAGNSYRGVSVNGCVEEAPRIAEEILEHLARTPLASEIGL